MTANKILIIGPAWVGDMVMAQCLFKLLKQRQPNATIDVLAPQWSLPLLARMPEVSDSIVMPIGHGKLALYARYRIGKQLREKKYQQAIVLPNSFKSALIPWWANIPIRTGWRREMRYGLLNDIRKLDKTRYPLMIEQFMALGLKVDESLPAEYPLPQLNISIGAREAAREKYQLTQEQPMLILCPGAEFGPAKRWPEEHYAAIASEKLRAGWQVLILGSPKDQSVAKKIMTLTANRCVDLTGKTQLSEAVDLLSLAQVVVSNDSGLMHIASSLQKPLIALYGPTSAAVTPPLSKQAQVLTLTLPCQPCFKRECPLSHHRCMRELTPVKVLDVMAGL